jgi:ElaB/YqjD/DUF883 family membrane-anchored ribosome-binding protein
MSMETDRIEADLNASRHRLNDTLSALGSKLSPGQMLDEVLGLAQGQAGQFTAKLGRQVRDNPLPTILIAAGVGMLFLNRQGSGEGVSNDDWHHERHYRTLEEARWATPRNIGETDEAWNDRVHAAYAKALDLKQMAGEAAHDFKERVSETVQGIQRRAAEVRDRVSSTASDVSHYAQDQARHLGQRASDVRHRAEDFYQDTPLAVGAIALAIGALIGSATPLSDAEREGLSGVADKATRTGADLADRAARAGADLAERGARAAEQAVDGAVH